MQPFKKIKPKPQNLERYPQYMYLEWDLIQNI